MISTVKPRSVQRKHLPPTPGNVMFQGEKSLVSVLLKCIDGSIRPEETICKPEGFAFDRHVWWLRQKWLGLPKRQRFEKGK